MRHQAPQDRQRLRQPLPFRPTPLAAAVVAGLTLLGASPSYAADDKAYAELQAEVTRLKQALEKSQQELAAKKAPAQAAPTAAGLPASANLEPAVAAAPVADEPQTLDTVVVRSRNRIERLQDVPLSVSVVQGKELERLETTDISAITKRVGNISWNYGNQRTFSLSLRGIGRQGQTEAQDPAVGLIVDGVSYAYNALASSFDFTDVEAVEVARGPQGTLLGKNASLGAVTVTTRRPSFTPSADYSLTFGSKDTVRARFAAGGPLVDGLLAYRASLSASKAKGDLVNNYNPDLTYTNTDRLTGRLQFLLTPTPDFNARLAIDVTPRSGEFTNGRTVYTPTPATYADGTRNTLSSDASTRLGRGWFTQQSNYTYSRDYLNGGRDGSSITVDGARPLTTGSRGIAAELNWNVANHTVTSITAYKDYHFNAVNDEGTPFDIYRNSGGFWNDYKQVSQEFRLSSQTGGFVDYQTGLYFLNVNNENDYRRVWGNDAAAWLATPAQYSVLDPASTNAKLLADPSLRASGNYLLRNSLANLAMSYNSPTGKQHIENKSQAIFGQANWHLSDALTVTTGLRLTWENRNNQGSTTINDQGNAPELNPVAINGVNLGGFASNSSGALGSSNTAAQLSLADQVAAKYFGKEVAGTPGTTYNSLTDDQKAQVAAAKGIRASAIGVVFNNTKAEPYKKVLPSYVISPTYKINENLTTYVSLQHGEKAGVAQFTNGISNPVKEEKTTAYEWGVKTALLDRTLILNTAVYLMNVKDYQQTSQVLDAYTTTLRNDGTTYYTNATGNVPKVQAKGVELDGVYSGIRNTTVRFSGAYNDARYKEFSTSPLPDEWNYTGNPYGNYRSLAGKALPGAAKWTYNIGVDYRQPVLNDKEFHTSLNVAYTSRWNSDVKLSEYAWIPSNYNVDFGIGLGSRKSGYDVTFLVKNLLNDKTHLTQSWNSFTPAIPRWYGIQFSGKL